MTFSELSYMVDKANLVLLSFNRAFHLAPAMLTGTSSYTLATQCPLVFSHPTFKNPILQKELVSSLTLRSMGLAFLNKVLTLQGLFVKPSNFHLCATSGISKQVKEKF